ncbi:MAG: GH92 family glycosyl hydrolase [Ignavibacteriales bacterium]|nr:MAG: GH92 family glycosyl hydrolase [Ignavibacteriales bacterium]
MKIIFFVLFIPILTLSQTDDVLKYVDPFIGTAEHGHTFPGACVPFGMVQLSPDNGTPGWDWSSGYNYADSMITGFSHTHLSGTGIGDLYDIQFMPGTKKINSAEDISGSKLFRQKFDHKNESASPGYYSVILDDSKVKVELTTTTRTGFHRYTFPESESSSILLDLSFSLNWDRNVESNLQIENDSTISGYRYSTGWAKDQRVYFVARFSKPFEKYFVYSDSLSDVKNKTSVGKNVKGFFSYNTKANEQILLKVGISYTSIEGARQNLDEENPNWNFDEIKSQAENLWRKELNKIKVTSDNEAQKKIFYTALYHSFISPYVYSDVDGGYRGADGKISNTRSISRYTVFSLWDTFRALHPLFTLVQPGRVNDLIISFLRHYKETGLLPVWELTGNETNTMIGYHAIPVIADAILKGFNGFDIELAYDAMKTSAMQDKSDLNFLRELAYIPADKENESVSKTLEYAYDDYCIAMVAKHLNKKDDYEYFMKRATNYKNLFNSTIGFMQGKNEDGTWKFPFDPAFSKHTGHDFTEGNSWQYSWFVPHDVSGLIKLMGGKEKFNQKLDSLFIDPNGITGDEASPDISGLIGQYAHGNEPSHHIAYLYNYSGEPWKSQKKVNEIMKTLYSSATNGLSGNEDCGQMSAWYVFSALGFYPVNPAEGIYVFGSPLFDKTEIHFDNGNIFKITAKNVSPKNIYISKIILNKTELNRNYIHHNEITNGGELIFEMSSTPNYNRGISPESFPPSMSN